jgi:hypothetical protein
MEKCTGKGCKEILYNCYQAYAKVGERDYMKVGCIYHPKAIGVSVEADSGPYPPVVN